MTSQVLRVIASSPATVWGWIKYAIVGRWRRRPIPHFDGWGFAVGSVFGIRDFRVTEDGTLTGVSHQEPWATGENIARHKDTLLYPIRKALQHRLEVVRVPADMEPDCACGFYAYFNAKWRAFTFVDGSRTLPGVIEAYGKVNLGSKGFRAEKAKIVALSLHQPWERRGSWDRPPLHWFWVAWMLGTFIGDAISISRGNFSPWFLLFDVVFWGTLGALHLFSVIDIYRARRAAVKGCPRGDSHAEPPVIRNPLPGFLSRIPFVRGAECRCTWRMLRATQRISDDLAAKIRAKYPDAQVFDSIDDMLKAFPLDQPPSRGRQS